MARDRDEAWGLGWNGRDSEGEAEDTFGFSFVDLVSGGFGAAFFLFLVFATLPLDSGSAPGGGDRFIGIWLTWDAVDESYEPIIEFRPQPSHQGEVEVWRRYRLSEGRLSAQNEFGEVTTSGLGEAPFWSKLLAAGFSDAMSPALRAYVSVPDDPSLHNVEGKAGLWMHFIDPCPGSYRVRINRNAGFDRHLADSNETSQPGAWKLILSAPNQASGFYEERTQADAIEPKVTRGLDAWAPVVTIRPAEADPEERSIFFLPAPKRKGTDLDHCH